MSSNDVPGLRKEDYFASQQESIYRHTDFLFAPLLALQWLAAIATALWISPRTWIGTTSEIHPHVWAAIFLGGVISSFPLLLIWKWPGHSLTRHAVAVAQLSTSALFHSSFRRPNRSAFPHLRLPGVSGLLPRLACFGHRLCGSGG
jgi:hypothetical protein